MSKIYCIANQKGGVGKTTTAVNLAAALAEMSYRVLLIDLDPQGNATTGSGIDKVKLLPSIYEAIIGQADLKRVITHSQNGYDVAGANRRLASAEEELLGAEQKELALKKLLSPLEDEYDVVLIDCPPTLSILTNNAFSASAGLIIPMTCEYFSLEGVSDLLLTIRAVREQINGALVISGLLRVKFDPRITLQRQVSDQLTEFFGKSMFGSVVPTNVRLAEAPSHGLSGLNYDSSSRGAQAYRSFAEEFAKREKLHKLIKRGKKGK